MGYRSKTFHLLTQKDDVSSGPREEKRQRGEAEAADKLDKSPSGSSSQHSEGSGAQAALLLYFPV